MLEGGGGGGRREGGREGGRRGEGGGGEGGSQKFQFLAENHGLYMYIVRRFYQICFHIHNFSLEGAT